MKKISRAVLLMTAAVSVAAAFASCAKKGTGAAAASPKQATQKSGTLTFESRVNVLEFDNKNYFNWSTGDKSVTDSLDAETGASRFQSVDEFDIVRYDDSGNKKKATPGGLRALGLLAVTAPATVKSYGLTVKSEGKKIVLALIRKDKAYRISTDDNGIINMNTSFEIYEGVAEKGDAGYTLKPEYVVEGGSAENMADANWDAIPFMPDTADADAAFRYDGVLETRYENGILVATGTLQKI